METLIRIMPFGIGMSVIALLGAASILVSRETLERWLLPLVAFAAGSLLGGAFFHMLPASIAHGGNGRPVWLAVTAGFVAFFCLEQFLHWHHCHRATHDHPRPLTWMILAADGLHNLIGGLSIGAVFLVEYRLGVLAWLAAAAHEVPQEIADFGILVHGGLSRRRALLLNVLSALTFPLGMVLAWSTSGLLELHLVVAFGAGNFIYIAAADLVPEVRRAAGFRQAIVHLVAFLAGLTLLIMLERLFAGSGHGG